MPGVSLNGSRLVRTLAGLTAPNKNASSGRFSERMGQLIDLSDSISLSEAHGQRAARAFTSGFIAGDEITAEYVRVRDSIVRSITRSFEPEAGQARIKLPGAPDTESADQSAAAEPYLKFYAAQQRELAFRVHNLHVQTRESVAGLSPELARLSALDAALGKTLAPHTRKFFAKIPEMIEIRFVQLQREAPTLPQEQRLRFHAELRELLLAELEARLLPVQGLIDAINEESDSKPYE